MSNLKKTDEKLNMTKAIYKTQKIDAKIQKKEEKRKMKLGKKKCKCDQFLW